MQKLKISRKNLPTGSPMPFTLSALAFARAFEVPGWLLGVFIAFIALSWLAFFVGISEEKQVDIFEDESKTLSFRQRIEKILSEQQSKQ